MTYPIAEFETLDHAARTAAQTNPGHKGVIYAILACAWALRLIAQAIHSLKER